MIPFSPSRTFITEGNIYVIEFPSASNSVPSASTIPSTQPISTISSTSTTSFSVSTTTSASSASASSGRPSKKVFYIFLFSDLVLISKRKAISALRKNTKKYHDHFMLRQGSTTLEQNLPKSCEGLGMRFFWLFFRRFFYAEFF